MARWEQAGFRKGRSCQNKIFSLNQIIEKRLEQQLPWLVNFIDFKAVFDSVHRPSLWEILKIYGIARKMITIIKNSYQNKVVEHFKYLWAFSSADGANVKKLNNRTGNAAGAFRELEKVWKDRHLNLPRHQDEALNSCVLAALLYAAECWSLTERDEARLDAFDMRCRRKILRIVWSQHITNKYVHSLTKQPVLSNTII